MYQRRSSRERLKSRNSSSTFPNMHIDSSSNNSDYQRDTPPRSWSRWILQTLRWLWSCLISKISSFRHSTTGPRIVFDTGRVVRQGRQIAEGGYSYVFEAVQVGGGGVRSNNNTYALKRIMVADRDMLESIQREVGVHRAVKHTNVMPLLGFSLQDHQKVAYLLFPYMAHSLRDEVNRRMLLEDSPHRHTPSPWPESSALLLFLQILRGVQALHQAGFSHRDLKLENILLRRKNSTPVLMDFGSCGPLQQSISTRRDVLEVVETASSHTTLPYRPPELLEGGVRAGDDDIDFRSVDVWSLGCTLFALLYGSSPMECEFRQHNNTLVVCDCTPLRILSGLPTLPVTLQQWYSQDTFHLIRQMLEPRRQVRISLQDAMLEVERILGKLGEQIAPLQDQVQGDDDDDEDEEGDMSALLARPSSYAV